MDKKRLDDMSQTLDEQHTQVAKGTFWGLAGSFALKFVGFIYLALISRLFTQDDIGSFNLALSLAYVFSMFGDFGLNAAFGRYVPYFIGKGQKEKAYTLLQTAYLWSGTFSCLLAIVLFFAAEPIADSYGNGSLVLPIRFVAMFLFFNTFLGLNTTFLAGLKRIKENNLLLNAQNVLKLAITLVVFWIVGPGALALSVGFAASYLIAAGASFWFVAKGMTQAKITKVKSTFAEQINLLKEVVPLGIMLSLVSTFWGIAVNVDRMMLGYLLPSEYATTKIAIYTLAFSLAVLVEIFPGAITAIFLPILAEMHGGNRMHESERVSKTAFRWILYLIVPVTILMMVYPSELLAVFYGVAYAEGGLVLAIFTLGMFIHSLSFVHGTILASMRIVRIEIYVALLALAVNVGLNILLIPYYGMEGSAIASAVAFCGVTLMLIYYCKKITGFGFAKEFIKPIVIAGITLLLFWASHVILPNTISLFPQITFGQGILESVLNKIVKLSSFGAVLVLIAGTYCALLSIARGFEKEDRELLGAVMRRGKVPMNWIVFVQSLMRTNERRT